MAENAKVEESSRDGNGNSVNQCQKAPKSKARSRDKDSPVSVKRRCVSTACIACRRRKSKCDGNIPSCAACSSVYGTECVYDPNSDHRRKGVYKKDIDNLKTRNSTLQTLIQAILNYPEHEVSDLVKQIRTCESLDDVAEAILARDAAIEEDEDAETPSSECKDSQDVPRFESELSGKMGELRLENGSVQFVGGTSNLIFLESGLDGDDMSAPVALDQHQLQEDPVTSWTTVTGNAELIVHLINMYFTWHYTYFTTLSKTLFYRDFFRGKPSQDTKRKNEYCTPLLVNAMLTLGCHFTSRPAARADAQDSSTAGDHFFKEAKRLILENDEHENPRLATVQALALMSVREAGCGREAKGWVYSGMSFRMACDLGLNVDSGSPSLDEKEVDARRITFWGSFLFDKCWSNYLGRQPQLPLSSATVPKFDVFPMEDAEMWSSYTDSGSGQVNTQPSRTRAIALQISSLCEISSDLLVHFYHPTHIEKPLGKQAELKKLSDLHTRLEAWRKNLPKEMEPKEGQLPNVLVMHMFFQLLFIHLFRPFLRYSQTTSPLPAHVSPRNLCTHAAAMISKLLRLYKRTYGLRQICNIAVYIAHSACTIHLLNLPDKNARRDIIHGLKQLEEIAEGWLCARRTLCILSILARRWKIDLPEEAAAVMARTDAKFASFCPRNQHTPKSEVSSPQTLQFLPTSNSEHLKAGLVVPKSSSLSDSDSANSMPRAGIQLMNGPSTTNSPPRAAANINRSARQQLPVVLQAQEEIWNQEQPLTAPIVQAHTSPSTLFNGIEPIAEEGQDWWLRDQSALAVGFDNWNSIEAEPALLGNGLSTTSNATPLRNGMIGTGYMDYDENYFAFNGGGIYE